jgi:hypothetical protein
MLFIVYRRRVARLASEGSARRARARSAIVKSIGDPMIFFIIAEFLAVVSLLGMRSSV